MKKISKYTLVAEYDNGDRETFNDAEVRQMIADLESKSRLNKRWDFIRRVYSKEN